MRHQAILWPDRVIGKRESRKIREAHNALYNDYHDLLAALKLMLPYFPRDIMVYSQGTYGERVYPAKVARDAIAKAEGGAA